MVIQVIWVICQDYESIGHLGNVRCNSGYIFNPSELFGEISNDLNVKCMEDKICGGTSWRLIDGSSVPECIEGN